MYKNRKFKKNANKKPTIEDNGSKRALNTIDENASIKIPRLIAKDVEDDTDDGLKVSQKYIQNDDDPGALNEMFSEENIPASQEPTQRYLSQRSTIAATLRRTQSNNSTCRAPNTYFELVLMKAGVSIDESECFVLSCDHISFVTKFREIMKKAQNYPENVDLFKSGLRNALNPNNKLALKLLSGCTINSMGDESVYQSQDSMIFNFLMIDFLRDHVVEVLLDRIGDVCRESVYDMKVNTAVSLLPLMLTQLQYVKSTHADLIFEKIKEIYSESNNSLKGDIVSTSEYTLDMSKHDEFVQMICDSVPNANDLFKSINIEAFINLSLSNRMKSQLRCRVLSYIQDQQCLMTNLPILVKLLLKALADDEDTETKDLINTLREILIWLLTVKTSCPNEKQIIGEIFTFIEQGLTYSKRFYTLWQKVIASLPGNQFRSVDLIILLVLVHIKDENALYVENIIRRRIKQEDISFDVLDEARTRYTAIIERYSHILIDILHDFLKEKTKVVADFAKSSYGILFEMCEGTRKEILKKLLDLTCDRTSNKMANLALHLIKELRNKYPKEIQNWGTMLLPLLDHLSELSLSQTRLVMEIVCSIAFPPPNMEECTALQDQIDMIVKKQIINNSPHVKKQGIIGSVQLIDNIVRIEEKAIESDDFNTTFSNVSDLPDGRGKVAANYITRIQTATAHCPETLALFYDELASVCGALPSEGKSPRYNYDKPFLIWLCEVMTYYFQNSFVAEYAPMLTINDIELDYLKCINSAEDTANTEDQQVLNIGINIAELVLKPTNEAASSILVLAPLLNLVRVICLQRYEGSLETINALLGCALVLPKFFDKLDEEEKFFEFDLQQQRQLLDIYFHCINWIRVTITSFASQREEMTRVKVLQRLADLMKMENKFRHMLRLGPSDYTPPMCQFLTKIETSTKAPGRPKTAKAPAKTKGTRQKAKTNITNMEDCSMNETNMNETNFADMTKKPSANKATKAIRIDFEKLYGPKENYRQMDSDIMLILYEKFTIEYPLPEEEVGKQFGLLELRFILNDIVCKLESLNNLEKDTSQQVLQHIAKPHFFINDLSKFLKLILENMTKIGDKIDEELVKVERIYANGNLFTEEFNYLKVCYGLSMHILSAYFAWTGFNDSANHNLLKESLLLLLSKEDQKKMKSKTLAEIAAEAFSICLKLEPFIVEIKTAIHLHQLLLCLKRYSHNANNSQTFEKQNKALRKLCQTFLCRKWFAYDGTLEKGSQLNIYLDELVKGFLKNSNFKRQQEILQILPEECKLLKGKVNALKSFPNFTKANFPLLFRGLCETLINSVNEALATCSTSKNDQMLIWESSCDLLNILLDIIQNLDIPRNFIFFLKYSHLYLKLVLQNGIQVFEQNLRQNPERVSAFLKNLQLTTRFLHNLCCHSKALKNLTIVNQIPFVRETVENLVYRVKALLAANKCASVFWMGNLLNKDLHGDQILSQSNTLNDEEEENSDEEIPEDDDSADETLYGRNNSTALTKSTGSTKTTRTSSSSSTASRSRCF